MHDEGMRSPHLPAVPRVLLCAALLGAQLFVSPASAASGERGERWTPPLGQPLIVSGPYQPPPTPYASGHRGIDLPAEPGDAIRAPAAGTVSFVGTVVDRGVLSLRIDDRTVLSLEPVTAETLAEGDSVRQGQDIGIMASGGHCATECVHLGVRIDGKYVNPMRYFLGKPVLVPW